MDDNAYMLGYLAGLDAGRQEVFDFLYENKAAVIMNENALEAKLKEWGLTPTKGER